MAQQVRLRQISKEMRLSNAAIWALVARLIKGVLNAVNRKSKKDAADNPADTIANGGVVQQSNKTFADLADKPKRD